MGDATMRRTHAAGEKLFVDFGGDTVPVSDGLTGEVRAATQSWGHRNMGPRTSGWRIRSDRRNLDKKPRKSRERGTSRIEMAGTSPAMAFAGSGTRSGS
jgi:hypothetical protein